MSSKEAKKFWKCGPCCISWDVFWWNTAYTLWGI